MRHTLVAVAVVALVYALTLASFDPADLATGALVGLALALLTRNALRTAPSGDLPSALERVLWFPLFVGAVLVDVARGTFDVALRVLHLRGTDSPGVVRIPIEERTERGVAVSALTTTLSPGAVLLDVDWERGDFLLHVIDASDPDEVRARCRRFYDRYQRRVFP